MSDPFAAPNPYAGLTGGFGGMASWGQPAGGGLSMEDQLQQAQMSYYQAQPGLQQQQLDIARQAAAPPSGWATGASTFGSIAQGLAGLGNIYLGLQGMKQQKKAFEFNKGVTNTNLNNSIMDYNRRLGDTLANRSLNNGKGESWAAQELAKYSARRS